MEKPTATLELATDILVDTPQVSHNIQPEQLRPPNSLQPIDSLVNAVLAVRRNRISS